MTGSTPASGHSLSFGVGPSHGGTALAISPDHPSAHGSLRLDLALDDDGRILSCEPEIGYLHRGVEKLFEVRDYRQGLMLADRHDWIAAFSNELGAALAVERLLGVEVPQRATWLRTLFAELTRIMSHLAFLPTPVEGVIAPAPTAQELRGGLTDLVERATGSRMHPMYCRVGGLATDLPSGWLTDCRAGIGRVRAAMERLREETLEPLRRAGVGIATLSTELADSYGASGPVARASAIDRDLRRDDPYLAYASLAAQGALRVVTAESGDAHARFSVLLDQVGASCDLVDACLDSLPAGPVSLPMPKSLKVPEGSAYVWTEAPSGIVGWYLASTGDKTPWRLKVRTPSFAHASLIPELVRGLQVADLPVALASLCYVVGDIDR
jgi:NADH-quinone oxidoreductase subunit D